jgi:hypothetical protein
MKPCLQAAGGNSGEVYGQLNCATAPNVPIGHTAMTFYDKDCAGR